LTDLTKHIVNHYHEPLRRELASLKEMAHKVANVHGQHHPELRKVEDLVTTLAADLLEHTAKEDAVLFPWICAVELGEPRPGRLEAPVSVMESEHKEAGALLESLRSTTNDYAPPIGACTTYRLLFAGLERLERELHLHIHLESSVLFPRALAMAPS
jgi:regulator of cell morphogenesis and NO signaling